MTALPTGVLGRGGWNPADRRGRPGRASVTRCIGGASAPWVFTPTEFGLYSLNASPNRRGGFRLAWFGLTALREDSPTEQPQCQGQ